MAEVDAQFVKASGALHDTETRLLTKFWKWARVHEQRIRRVETSDAISAARLAAMDERISRLESKKAEAKNSVIKAY